MNTTPLCDCPDTTLGAASESFSILSTARVPVRTALRVARLTVAAAKHMPVTAARELAANLVMPLECGEEPRTTIAEALSAHMVSRGPGSYMLPAGVDIDALAGDLLAAWLEVSS